MLQSITSHSDQIRDKIQLMGTPRANASKLLWEHPRLKEILPWAIVRSYIIANASVPLMKVALERVQKMASADPVAAAFVDFLEEHIPEESGHDEQVLEDLESVGFAKDKVRSMVPWPSLAGLIGMQYYWVLHRHPIAFVGYAATIEGGPVPVEQLEAVRDQTGLPHELFRTLIWHSRHDVEHSAELDRTLDEMPLTPEHMSLIGVNVAHTQNLLANSVHEMIDSFENQGLALA